MKSTIRAYYNATDGIADKDSSPYISELKRSRTPSGATSSTRYEHAIEDGVTPAIVFDADDTTLWTYDMEDAAMGFNFDSVLQNEWVQDKLFPATPGMVRVREPRRATGLRDLRHHRPAGRAGGGDRRRT